MYKHLTDISDVLDWRQVNNKVWHKTEKEKFKIVERDLTSMQVLWKSNVMNIADFAANSKWIIYDSDEKNGTSILSTKNKEEYFSFNNRFVFWGDLLNDNYLLGNSRKKQYIVNILSKQIQELPKEDYGFYHIKDKFAICINKAGTVLSCRNIENNLSLIWLFNISTFGTFRDIIRGEKERSINYTYLYKDKLIASISRAIIALDINTGELIWKVDTQDFNADALLINNNKCYIAKGVYYMVIDLDNGKKIFETEKKQIEYNDKKILLFRESGITYHDNQIWYLFTDVINDPQRYLASFAPETLELQSIQPIPIYDQHRQPVFYGNRLYVLEDSGTLNIFEKE